MAALFRLPNLLEIENIPTFFVTDVGQITVVEGMAQVVMCRLREIAGQTVFVPQCEIIRTVESMLRHSELNQKLLASVRIKPRMMQFNRALN